ncbi:MAG: NAD(P)/FAD-dependent oxidoreductase [Phycisphaerales bacterium]
MMSSAPGQSPQLIVIGAGMTGLSCAIHLTRSGRRVTVLEASDAVGGRVRTDLVDGFRLDRGFQVLLDAYPECRELLDYSALDLKPFYAGALVRFKGEFHTIADPWRHPIDAAKGFLSPVSSLTDKARLAPMGLKIIRSSLDSIWSRPERATIDLLREAKLSDAVIDRFFRPFFGGVFFDRDLNTSSRMFEFCFRMFAKGHATVPASGMQAIPEQLAAHLPDGSIRLNTRVASVDATGVTLESGERLDGTPILATDIDRARELLGAQALPPREWNSTITMHYSADAPPIDKPILILDGDGTGPVNHLAVMTNTAPSYAPEGKALIAANIVGSRPEIDQELDALCRDQLTEWFGNPVRAWRLLRIDRINHALPRQPPGTLTPHEREFTTDSGIIVCGDHLADTSLNGAMGSGKRAARILLDH